MKLFCDCIKDATAQSVHVPTALGNERKRRATNRLAGELSEMAEVKTPDYSLRYDEGNDPKADVVRDFRMPFEVKKAEPDQQLIFGWASVVEKDGKLVVDKQGDMIPVNELENAAYDFVLYSREQGDMHGRIGVGKMVESMVFTKEKQAALGVDLGMVGWWVGFKVNDEVVWAAHKRGDRLEFSIGGAAVPIEVEKKGGRRLHTRYPFDEGAYRGAHFSITRLLTHQQGKVLRAYEQGRPVVPVIDEDDNVLQHTVQAVRGHLLRALQRTGAYAVERLTARKEVPLSSRIKIATNVDDWAYKLADERSHSLFGRKINKAVRSTSDTTKEIIAQVVEEGLDKGWSVQRLREELQKAGVFAPGRAEMIARTEISAAQNAAMLKAGYEYEDEMEEHVLKIWLLGPNPCPICEDNGDEELNLDDTFTSGHMAPPVHPNCMCELQLIEG